jgi:hypothetical protein
VVAYVTTDEATAEGIAVADADRLQGLIERASLTIENLTGKWFEPRALQFKVSGDGSTKMRFKVPIIEIDWIKYYDYELSPDYYFVHNRQLQGLTNPDDRRTPWIELLGIVPGTLVDPDTQVSLYDQSVFAEGRMNYEVKGIWGYTEWDGHLDTVLPYDGQTGNFTIGDIVTGALSGATGTITGDSDAGTTGVLTLEDVDGHFQNDESLADEHTGAAKANISTHWQGVTPAGIKAATIYLVRRHEAKIGNPLFDAVYLKGKDAGRDIAMPYSIVGDPILDELLLPFMGPAHVGIG